MSPVKPISTDYARWSDLGANNIEAAPGVKDAGYSLSDVAVSSYYNYTLNAIHDWLTFLNDPVGTGTAAAISATGSATAGNIGLEGVAGGSHGYGLKGSGPSGSNLPAIYGEMGVGWGNPGAVVVGPDTNPFPGGTMTDYAAYMSSQNGPGLVVVGGEGASSVNGAALIAIGRTGSPAAAFQGGIGVSNSVYITAANGSAGNAPGKYGLYCVSGTVGSSASTTPADAAAAYFEGKYTANAIYAKASGAPSIYAEMSSGFPAIYGKGLGVASVGGEFLGGPGFLGTGLVATGGTAAAGNVEGATAGNFTGGEGTGNQDGGSGVTCVGGAAEAASNSNGGRGGSFFGGVGDGSGIGGLGIYVRGGVGGKGASIVGGSGAIGINCLGGAGATGMEVYGGSGDTDAGYFQPAGAGTGVVIAAASGAHLSLDSTTLADVDAGSGDLWFTGSALKFKIGATTYTLAP